MILGVHSATFVKNWHEDITPYIHKCKQAGYKCVEVSLLGQTPSSAKEISKLANDLNISLTCTTGLSKNEDISSSDPVVQKNGVKALKRAIDMTSIMEANLLTGVVHAAWGVSNSLGKGKEDKFKNSSNSIKKISSLVIEKNIKLGIEPLNRYQSDFINTVDEGIRLCELSDHPNVGLLLDAYHMNIEEKNMCQSIEKARDKLFHKTQDKTGSMLEQKVADKEKQLAERRVLEKNLELRYTSEKLDLLDDPQLFEFKQNEIKNKKLQSYLNKGYTQV